MRARGFFDILEALSALVVMMAHHWCGAIPLLLWPELTALGMVLSANSANGWRFGGWTAWLVTVLAAQGFGVWIAVMRGWAWSDKRPSLVVAAFFSSLPGAIAGMWFFQFVEDMRDRQRASA